MANSYRVAIVAKPDDPAAQPDPTIEAFAANLAAHMPVRRAAHMTDVDACLNAFWTDDARAGRRLSMVICGHGSSGLVHLGSSWMQPGAGAPLAAFQYPFFLIDTNPWSLRRIGDHRDRLDTIVLLACNVGLAEAEGYSINGRTLSYTLCEHLNTTVHAAMDWVTPDEVKQTGDYMPANRRPSTWTYRGTAAPSYVDPNHGTPPTPHPVAEDAKRFRIVTIVGARVPTMRHERIAVSLDVEARRLNDARLAFASPELILEVVDEAGASSTAAMYANGRVLRVGSTFYAVESALPASRAIAKTLAG